jgi:predicted membrane-bound mannosyltransferase
MVQVAIGGSVGGFGNLIPGAKYYLSELAYYYEQRSLQNEENLITIASLTSIAPETTGSAVQAIAVATSENEILIMPSLEFSFVGGKVTNSDFMNSYNDQLIIDNQQPTINNEQTTTDEQITDNVTTTEEEIIPTTTEEEITQIITEEQPTTEEIAPVAPEEPVVVVEEAPVQTEEASVEVSPATE